jgi:hypothetical protein
MVRHGDAGHVSLDQFNDVGDRELPHSSAGRAVARCEDCAYTLPQPALPEVPGAAAPAWRAETEPLPLPCFHTVFTLPAAIEAAVASAPPEWGRKR